MDYGINIATSSDSWRVVQRAEELGYSYAWFYDTQLLSADVFVAMAAAAMKTSKIRLGTGVLIPSNRIPAVTANALASLNKLAPGRIEFGVSTGFTARRSMGLPAIKLAEMRDHIRVVQGLLAGETVEWETEGASRKIRFLNPDIGQINIEDPIPTHISALGPRGRKLTAELGANWLNTMRGVDDSIAGLEAMKQAWRDAGRPQDTLYSTAIAGGCVLAEGESADSPRVKAQAGPHASMIFHNLAEAAELGSIGYPVPPPLQAQFDAYCEIYKSYEPADARYLQNHRGHLMFLRPEEEANISGDMIRMLSFTATAPELREGVRALKSAGYSQFAPHIRYGHDSMLEDWAEVFNGV
ncbi:MAG: LLM class flavin-dependent oxidoreductase [Rhodospirillales bacterium]|nr:LLM class flavin-dependent oxidoreductase [Rhodospirillales bacterium]